MSPPLLGLVGCTPNPSGVGEDEGGLGGILTFPRVEMEIEIGTMASTVYDSIAISHIHALYVLLQLFLQLSRIDVVILQLLCLSCLCATGISD